jgi:CRP-like cAMP-binding protein
MQRGIYSQFVQSDPWKSLATTRYSCHWGGGKRCRWANSSSQSAGASIGETAHLRLSQPTTTKKTMEVVVVSSRGDQHDAAVDPSPRTSAAASDTPNARCPTAPRGRNLSSYRDLARLGSLPKLQRKLSLPLLLQQEHRVASAPPDHKVQKYERMMDRFQLRRIPKPQDGDDRAGSMGTMRLSRNASRDKDIAVEALSAPTLEIMAQSQRRSNDSYGSARVLREPSQQTVRACQIRLVATSWLFLLQAVHGPFAVAYDKMDNDAADMTIPFLIATGFVGNLVVASMTSQVNRRGVWVRSQGAIWRVYRRSGLWVDVAAALPFELLMLCPRLSSWVHWIVLLADIATRALCIQRQVAGLHRALADQNASTAHSAVAWLTYSRYSHLVRILAMVLGIAFLAHYLACFWTGLQYTTDISEPALTRHFRRLYDALQMLQGQGVTTTTLAQHIFASVSVLLGSVTVAVIFGHVAILVSNFTANQTSYQRKMENVFAIMDKLQMPHPIRERIHQYYEHLLAEYESLDGEVVKFAKELSHTLELEVVLFKYMDVVMHVSHWHECSPDFQKQLALSLSMRVYLADDFVMRRGEVGLECYILNRGTCKLIFADESDRLEYPTPCLPEMEQSPTTARRARARKTQRPVSRMSRMSHYSQFEGIREHSSVDEDQQFHTMSLQRGQAVGVMALVSNYKRSCDLRATTNVEMCVLNRKAFQQLLVSFPGERAVVLHNILCHHMEYGPASADVDACELMRSVRAVVPEATTETAVPVLVKAMTPAVEDPSILFGVSEVFEDRIRQVVGTAAPRETAVASSGVASCRGECQCAQRQEVVLAGIEQNRLRLEAIERLLEDLQHQLVPKPCEA